MGPPIFAGGAGYQGFNGGYGGGGGSGRAAGGGGGGFSGGGGGGSPANGEGYGGGGGGSYIAPLFSSTQATPGAGSGNGSVVITLVTPLFTDPLEAFGYTGTVQTFTVPAAGTYTITAVGAGGGTGFA